ncbi:MAG: hypothetical protein ACFFCM_21265 [Promethearchaeota archaeon]
MENKKNKNKEEEFIPKETKPIEPLIQMVIDPETGRDITGEHIAKRLKELEYMADEIISFAIWRWERNKEKKEEILEETEEYLRQRIGCGSIGPATAAAGPLMYEKISELHKIFEK